MYKMKQIIENNKTVWVIDKCECRICYDNKKR